MNAFPNRRWLVIPTSIVDTIDFNTVHENSADTLRLSVDGTKTFIKYEITEVLEDQVITYTDLDTGQPATYTKTAGIYGRPPVYSEDYTEYTYEEILTLLSTEEWTIPMEPTN
jgi:hypothetical protein